MQARKVVDEKCEVLPYADDAGGEEPEQSSSSKTRAPAAAKSACVKKSPGLIQVAPQKRRLGQPSDREAEVVVFECHVFFSVVHLHIPLTLRCRPPEQMPSPCALQESSLQLDAARNELVHYAKKSLKVVLDSKDVAERAYDMHFKMQQKLEDPKCPSLQSGWIGSLCGVDRLQRVHLLRCRPSANS